MLQLTKRTEYGLIALTHLAGREGSVVSAREIGEHYPVPRRLLAEVLKELCRSGLVVSHRGAAGGYSLARSADAITVGEVVGALEGHPSLASCASLGAYVGGQCDVEEVCPIRSPIHRLRAGIWSLFERTSLRDLVPKTPAVTAGLHR
jgi:Rrf2 family protein